MNVQARTAYETPSAAVPGVLHLTATSLHTRSSDAAALCRSEIPFAYVERLQSRNRGLLSSLVTGVPPENINCGCMQHWDRSCHNQQIQPSTLYIQHPWLCAATWGQDDVCRAHRTATSDTVSQDTEVHHPDNNLIMMAPLVCLPENSHMDYRWCA